MAVVALALCVCKVKYKVKKCCLEFFSWRRLPRGAILVLIVIFNFNDVNELISQYSIINFGHLDTKMPQSGLMHVVLRDKSDYSNRTSYSKASFLSSYSFSVLGPQLPVPSP